MEQRRRSCGRLWARRGSLINAGVMEMPLEQVFTEARSPQPIRADVRDIIQEGNSLRQGLLGAAQITCTFDGCRELDKSAALRKVDGHFRRSEITVSDHAGSNAAGLCLDISACAVAIAPLVAITTQRTLWTLIFCTSPNGTAPRYSPARPCSACHLPEPEETASCSTSITQIASARSPEIPVRLADAIRHSCRRTVRLHRNSSAFAKR